MAFDFLGRDAASTPEADVQIIKPIFAPPASRKDDPFLEKVTKTEAFHSLPDSSRRKYRRLEKRHDIHKEAKSKALESAALSAYDVFRVVHPPYDLDGLAKLYEKNAAHNAAVTSKAVNVCGLGWELIENGQTRFKIEQIQGNKDKIKRLTQDLKKERLDLLEIFDHLNFEDEFGELMVKIWTDVEAMGNGYLEIGRNRNGTIGYLGHIPANTLRIRSDRDGYIQISGNKYVFFRNYADDQTLNPLGNDDNPNELMHFKKYSPHSTYYGIPDVIAALYAVAGDTLAKEYNLEYFENKAVPRYAFITKGVRLSDEAQARLTDFFRNQLKGRHHGTLYIPLPASINQNVDAKFEAIENRPQDQSFTDFIKDSRLEVLMVHRVPPSKVGIYENTNLAVSRDADRTFKEQVCRPEQRRVEKKLNHMMKEFTDRFQIKFTEADVIDADVKSRVHERYLRTATMKPNEVRREVGMPSDPEGDEFLPYPPQLALPQNKNVSSTPGRKPLSAASESKVPARPDESGQRKERGESQDRGASTRIQR